MSYLTDILEEQEGKLSKLKSKIVSETYLTLKANALDLGKYLLLSQEEQQAGGAKTFHPQ